MDLMDSSNEVETQLSNSQNGFLAPDIISTGSIVGTIWSKRGHTGPYSHNPSHTPMPGHWIGTLKPFLESNPINY